MNSRFPIILLMIVVVVWIGTSFVFVVNERERALVLAFGEIIADDNGVEKVYEPGLHFKWPLIDSVIKIDARIQTLDGDPDLIKTINQKDLEVDTYVKWKVVDFAHFYRSTGASMIQAQNRLETNIENALLTEFGQRTRQEVVSGEREEVMGRLSREASKISPELGMEIIDVRVKKINLPKQVSQSIYDRMIKERERIANQHRSDGQKEKNIIQSKADAEIRKILAEADRTAREIRGKADAEAAKIYADTYSKNKEFYSFLRSIDAYKASFSDKNDILVIKPDSDFFKYMKDANGKK